jgi:hypothetical protein
MKKTLSSLFLMAVLLVVSPAAFGQFAATGTTNVTVTVAAEAAISVNSASPLTSAGTLFANYTGSTSFTYKVRTKATGGSGSITAQVTTDFGPTGGPSVAAPPTAGDTLSYGCSLTGVGTACSGSVTASTTAATNVATFATNARSAKAGDTGSLAWVLVNDPQYQTGSYTAVVTLSISAL